MSKFLHDNTDADADAAIDDDRAVTKPRLFFLKTDSVNLQKS